MSDQLLIRFLLPATHWQSGLFQFAIAILFAMYFCALFLYISSFSAMAKSCIIPQFSSGVSVLQQNLEYYCIV